MKYNSKLIALVGAVFLHVWPFVAAAAVVSRIQAPQVIDGPNNNSDTIDCAFWNGSEFSMYKANAYVYNMRGEDMRSVSEDWDFYADASTSLSPGTDFDDIGTWLQYVELAQENTNLVRGFYHAEGWETNGANVWDRKKLAYCESGDGGRTFQKVCAQNPALDYPNNEIISNWTGVAGIDGEDSCGDGHFVIVGNYYYCYFLATSDWKTQVARSAYSSHGQPGTWYKYYDPTGDGGTNGTWTEPGLGGNSSCPFPNDGNIYGREMAWNNELGRFMLDIDYYSPGPGSSGIYLAFSTNNLFGWQRAPYPLIAFEGVWTNAPNWNRDIIPAKELQAYYTFAADDGTTYGGYPPLGGSCGTSFWYVATYLNPHEGFDQRYLLRQKVNLSQTTSSAPQDQVGRVELALFRCRDGSDDWATAYDTLGHYYKIQTLGYLCTANIAGTAPLYCLINSATNHLVSLNPAEATELNLLGYIFTNQVSGTIALYRTTNALTGSYSATTNANAPGVNLLMGYIFPPVGDETFAYRYDATEQTEVINGGAETIPLSRTGLQGYDNWFYEERVASRSLVPLTYNPASAPVWAPNPVRVWASTNGPTGARLDAYGGTPGVNSSAVRQWEAIDTGIAYINARAFSRIAAGGSGVNVLIQKNGQLLWQSPVTNGQSSAQAVEFEQWITVTRRDVITFEIAPLSSSSTNDDTYFRPIIWFQWGSLLSGTPVTALNLHTNLSFQWPGIADQTYIIESSPQLTGPWAPVSPPILASPPTNTFILPFTNSPGFYRLRLVQ